MPASRPRILVTRSPRQASALADRLRELGAEPILVPTIETVEPTSFAALDAVLDQLSSFHWLLFTSANAVEVFGRRLAAFGHALPACRVAAVGPATARALSDMGLSCDLQPPQAVAESFAEALLPFARQPEGVPTRFLLVRAEEAREHLPDVLRASGAVVTVAAAYRTVIPEAATERIRQLFASEPTIHAVTFTSSSTARNLFALLQVAGCALPANVVRASIGPITSATLQELGFPPHVEAPQATIESLAENVVKYLHSHASS